MLAQCIYEYENIAGFYFSQLLNYLIENGIKQGVFERVLIQQYFEKINYEQDLTTKNGWPNSFGRVFLEKNKNEKFRKEMDSLVMEASNIGEKSF